MKYLLSSWIILFLLFACSPESNTPSNNDTTPPVITLLGSANITIEQFDVYIDPGATATDNVDGDLTDNIVVSNNVDTNIIGSYNVTYSVSDSSGNNATATRSVTVEPYDNLTYVPDDNFEQALIGLGYDDVLDDYVLTSNISGVTDLILIQLNISDLTGIEDFIALESLACHDNQLTSLDVSQNTALDYLNCSDNLLTTLDVSQNTALDYLSCSDNLLTTLDVSKNLALEVLQCDDNQLTSLDVSQNTALYFLNCRDNLLTTLDVSQNTALEVLACYYNQLNTLVVSGAAALVVLNCNDNQLTSLDVSQNTALVRLACHDNQLTSLDLSQNTAFLSLHCEDNQLTSLDVSNGNNLNMYVLNALDNNLTCVQIDQGFTPPVCDLMSETYWCIDSTASYSTNCN